MRVDGQLVFNGAGALLSAALKDLGLAYLTEGQVQPHLAAGRLVRVLSDWCPHSPAITLTTRAPGQASPALALLVDALRYRGKA